MAFRPRPNHPYAHAPRVPDGAYSLDDLIGGTGPFEIEIGPGRGGFLFERAAAAPHVRIAGLEIRLKWSAIVDERLKKQGFGERARAFNADAKEALARLGPDASVSVFYLHFPDPWWKKKHTKRLVMGDILLTSVVRLLKLNGELFVQTDVEERADMYEAQIMAHGGLVPAGDAPGSPRMAENPYGALSPREHHAVADGIPIYRMRFKKV
ncbi:MAG: tRNA (guanine-N7)-methyltransferase [Polyangiaceae bacterium]|nr:tRNA (guanine-N7)-methyltransferase [Polyangiaceae bacterium]